jgi:hypothetical protein
MEYSEGVIVGYSGREKIVNGRSHTTFSYSDLKSATAIPCHG